MKNIKCELGVSTEEMMEIMLNPEKPCVVKNKAWGWYDYSVSRIRCDTCIYRREPEDEKN